MRLASVDGDVRAEVLGNNAKDQRMTLWAAGFKRNGLTWTCNDCSAVVKSREAHTDWHRRLLAAVQAAVMA